jgi:hypothetical protein
MSKLIIILLCVLGVVIIGGVLVWQLWPKNNGVACTMEAKLCPDGSSVGRVAPDCEFAVCPIVPLGEDQKSYINEELGIRFDLSDEFTKVFGRPNSADKFNGIAGSGIGISFGADWEIGSVPEADVSLVSYTQHYDNGMDDGFSGWRGQDNVVKTCNKQLDYSKDVICKVIDLAGTKAVFQTTLSNYEMSCIFSINLYFNNLSSSIYKGINLSLYLKDIEEKVCNDGQEWPENYSEEQWWGSIRAEFENQSRNIMEMRNLSVKDKEALEALNQMLSTFKFINQ